MDNRSGPLEPNQELWLFPINLNIETWHTVLENELRHPRVVADPMTEGQISDLGHQMVERLEGFKVIAACVTKEQDGFQHQAVLAVLKKGSEIRRLLIHRRGLEQLVEVEETSVLLTAKSNDVNRYLKSKKVNSAADDTVESVDEKKASEGAELAVKTIFKQGTATTPTLVDLHLACLATHRNKRNYNMISANCYWWSDTVIAILERVAGPDGYDVVRQASKLEKGEKDPEVPGDFGMKEDGTFYRIPWHWRQPNEIEEIHREFLKLTKEWIVSLPHLGENVDLPAHSPESWSRRFRNE